MQLNAQKREEKGKENKKLRKAHILPAVVIGKDMDSLSVKVANTDFIRLYREAGETNIVELEVENDQTYNVLVKNVTYHPVNDSILHIDFLKINLDEKISANVPVVLIGEEENELIRTGNALPLLIINEVTVEALPTDLIDSIEVDVSNLSEIGDGIEISQLDYNRDKIEIVDYEEDELVVKLDYAVREETEEEEELTEEELLEQVEVTGEKEPTEDDGSDESEE